MKKLTGAERLILKLAEHLARLGHRVEVVSHYIAPACQIPLGQCVSMFQTERKLRLFGSHYLDAFLEYLLGAQLVKYISPDADLACFFGPPSLPALSWAKTWRRAPFPCLYFCYEPPRFVHSDRREIVTRLGVAGRLADPFFSLYGKVDSALVRLADGVLVNGPFGRERIRAAYGLPSSVITHGVDFDPATPEQVNGVLERLGLSDGAPTIITVNHLHPRKRIDLLIEALPPVLARVPDAVALIVGTGPEEARLRELVRRLGLGKNVRFCGFVPDEDLPAYYAASQVYAHLGKLESFGLSVIEAEASGRPVVAVNEGGPRETVVDGRTGYLVDADPSALAEKLILLLENPERAKAMGLEAQRHICENYSWEAGAKDFLAACQQFGVIQPMVGH